MTESVAREPVVEQERTEPEAVEIPRHRELDYLVQRRLEVIRKLEGYRGQREYREEEAKAAGELNLSVRSLKRLVRQYRDKGIEGLKRQARSDEGRVKVSEEWRKFIVETYRKGNRGMRQTSRAQVALQVQSRAAELGERDYPSRRTVYRILEPEVARGQQKQKKRRIGWIGDELKLTTRDGTEIAIDHSNQVWQIDHTPADVAVVDDAGELLGRPTFTTVIDTYSRCIVGFHLGMERASAAVTCLALRHAILPKDYGEDGPDCTWDCDGTPKYLYTDAGVDFTSSHFEQVASHLGIVACLRRRPSDGGIVERPFGTISRDFFATLPGYTTSLMQPHLARVKAEASLTIEQVEKLLVRYVVDNYNQRPDARQGQESRMERWKSGLMAQGMLPSERELDLLLMRQERRRVYEGGYIRFANLVYRGEYLSGYGGQTVVLRYDPKDITTIYVYQSHDRKEELLARAHATSLETERLSLAEAKAIARRLRATKQEISNQSVLVEVRERQQLVEEMLAEKAERAEVEEVEEASDRETAPELLARRRPSVPQIRVFDYDQLRQDHGM